MKNKHTQPVIRNKKARFLYEILETLEAGIVLMGSEVKSIRAGKLSFKDGYARIHAGEIFLVDVHISPYENAVHTGHEPERVRKLLLHVSQIKNWQRKTEQKGLTIVPLKAYFKNGRVKIELALGKGKKIYDRRENIRDRDLRRDLERSG